MNTKAGYIAGALIVLIFIGGVMWLSRGAPEGSPVAEENANATSTPATPSDEEPSKQGNTAPFSFSLLPGDNISSWNYPGAYTGNADLIVRAQTEIARLSALVGTGEATTYEIYVSIANQYGLMGDGENEYTYLKKALAIDSTRTGLAWYNMGTLMKRFGAYNTARFSYENAFKTQPIQQYGQGLLSFLKEFYPGETEEIEALEEAFGTIKESSV